MIRISLAGLALAEFLVATAVVLGYAGDGDLAMASTLTGLCALVIGLGSFVALGVSFLVEATRRRA